MWIFIGLIALLIFFIVFCILSVEWSMHLCVEFWNDKQYRLWKIICGLIGCCFLIAIIFVCAYSTDRFSDSMIKTTVILVVAAYLAMCSFLQIVHFVAWKNKCKILKDKITKTIQDNSLQVEESILLSICVTENKEYFTEKQIKRVFIKIYSQIVTAYKKHDVH